MQKGGTYIKLQSEFRYTIVIFMGLLIFILIHWFPYNSENGEIIINDNSLSYENTNEGDIEIIGERLNLNTATVEELDSLMYIGKEDAELIVRFREENGDFENVEDINEVEGLSTIVRKVIIDYTYVIEPIGG